MPNAAVKLEAIRPLTRLGVSLREVPPFSSGGPAALALLDRFLTAVVNAAERWLSGRHFRLKATVMAVLVSLATSLPPYRTIIPGLHHAGGELKALTFKVRHPLTPFPPELRDPKLGAVRYGTASHIDKLELRLTAPLLGRLSHTGAWSIFVWNQLAAVIGFYLLTSLAYEALGDAVASTLFTIGLGATFFGNWLFRDFGYGDGIAFCFLLLAAACRQPLLAGASVVAAGFTDERALTAVPLLLVYLAIRYRQVSERAQRSRLWLAVIAGVAAWTVLRLWLARTFHLSTGTSNLGNVSVVLQNLSASVPWALLQVFKVSWILLPLGLLVLIARRNWMYVSAVCAAFGVAVAPAFAVMDFDRSAAYTFVVLLVSLHFLWGDKGAARKLLAAIMVANVLLSAPGGSVLRVLWS